MLDYQQWDIDTLTASDYTVEYVISESMWETFNLQLGSHAQLPAGNSAPNHNVAGLPVVTFEAFLEHYFTHKLNQMPYIHEEVEIRISNITFGFNNQELLAMLTERGTLITAGKLDKIPEVNEKIDELIKEKRTEL